MSAFLRNGAWSALLHLALVILTSPVNAAFINYVNCLNPSIVNSSPLQLQWIPLFFDAKFDTTNPSHSLNISIYGNVSGQQIVGTYPPPDSPQWSDPNNTFGKITDIGSANLYSTLFAASEVLTYNAWNNGKGSEFCPNLIGGTCPLGPSFGANASDAYDLPAFTVAHDFRSPYRFSTLATTLRVVSGDTGGPDLACVSANITPYLGNSITNLLTWLPAAVLILKGLATLSAAIWSPWGSSDIFRWSSNYGRDEDLLRLVTPGFGDCLQYIQFVTLTGALSLQYPGYYQPAVSQTGWSLLLFNESFVSHGNGTQSLVDGIYAYNGTYGMTAMSQLIGVTSVEDIWACMAIWLLVIAVIVILLCQLGFFGRWIYRTMTHTTEEDLRQKNLPFTLGNMIRLLFNYFILPIVALSLFQLVIAGQSPIVVVVMAVILFVLMLVAGGWILRTIFTTKPRTYLFDDMPTVLLYGPLYNTYSDSAAPFALVPVFITFVRGVAIGAVQPSGIAQIIILAICEVILILTLNGFRPFQNQTSMNAYHTFFAVVRLITVLLSIAFVPSLGVSEASKGWIGYAMLILHACVLVFGFFLNAAQTVIEIVARSLGVAGDAQSGAIRGSILNIRMLKKRRDRPNTADRSSMASNAAFLRESQGEDRSANYCGRSRSMSTSSQQLLNQVGGVTSGASGGTPSVHRMSGLEYLSSDGQYVLSTNPEAETAQGGFTFPPAGDAPGKPALGVKDPQTADTYYRPPRPRRTTLDPLTPGTKTRKSAVGEAFPYQDSPDKPSDHARESSYEPGFAGRDSPAPAYFRDHADSNENLPRTDYAVREVDQYYRGQALSDQPTRKLKTGPADPEGPAASAQSWFQRLLFGVKGKQKEATKGFEVVRSSRMPIDMLPRDAAQEEELEMQTSPHMHQEPYQDSPPMTQGEQQAAGGAERNVSPVEAAPTREPGFAFGYDGPGNADRDLRPDSDTIGQGMVGGGLAPSPTPFYPGTRTEHPGERSFDKPNRPRLSSEDAASSYYPSGGSDLAPYLAPIEAVGGFDVNIPSRFNSRRSDNFNLDGVDIGNTAGGQDWLRAVDDLEWSPHERAVAPAAPAQGRGNAAPSVPPRSSKRTPSGDLTATLGAFNHSGTQLQPDHAFDGSDSKNASPNLWNPPGGILRRDERPASFDSVNHRRAVDSISRNSLGTNAALQGSSAEIFAASPSENHGFGGK